MSTYLRDNFNVGDLVTMKYAGKELMGHVTDVGTSILRMAFDYEHGRPGLWHIWQTSCGVKSEVESGILRVVARANQEHLG